MKKGEYNFNVDVNFQNSILLRLKDVHESYNYPTQQEIKSYCDGSSKLKILYSKYEYLFGPLPTQVEERNYSSLELLMSSRDWQVITTSSNLRYFQPNDCIIFDPVLLIFYYNHDLEIIFLI
jgi:hypothetical protein